MAGVETAAMMWMYMCVRLRVRVRAAGRSGERLG